MASASSTAWPPPPNQDSPPARRRRIGWTAPIPLISIAGAAWPGGPGGAHDDGDRAVHRARAVEHAQRRRDHPARVVAVFVERLPVDRLRVAGRPRPRRGRDGAQVGLGAAADVQVPGREQRERSGTEPSTPLARSRPRTPELPPLRAYGRAAGRPVPTAASANTQMTVRAMPALIASTARVTMATAVAPLISRCSTRRRSPNPARRASATLSRSSRTPWLEPTSMPSTSPRSRPASASAARDRLGGERVAVGPGGDGHLRHPEPDDRRRQAHSPRRRRSVR